MVCEKRRRLIMSTGLWYHGYHPEADLPLERELEDQLDPREEVPCENITNPFSIKSIKGSIHINCRAKERLSIHLYLMVAKMKWLVIR